MLVAYSKNMLFIKRKGFTDKKIAQLMKTNESNIRKKKIKFNVKPVYKRVDTCAAEFPTSTSYLYSTYEDFCESSSNKK